MTVGKYVLGPDGEPVRETDLLKWAEWYERADRQVALEVLGDVYVSTIFLGLDFRHFGKGPPILWETRVFGGECDGAGDRYTTRAAALAGHDQWVAEVRARAGK